MKMQNRSGMANVEIGDLSQWYFVDEDGQKVYLSSNSTCINEEGIKDTIYRLDSTNND